MANQTGTARSGEFHSPVPLHRKDRQIANRANEAVARRAYSLFLADGGVYGHELRHWLQAESEILTRIPEISESGPWYTFNTRLAGFSTGQVRVGIDANQAIIIADKPHSADQDGGKSSSNEEECIFLIADWPSEVDPDTASAYLKNDSLVVTVKQAIPSQRAEQ